MIPSILHRWAGVQVTPLRMDAASRSKSTSEKEILSVSLRKCYFGPLITFICGGRSLESRDLWKDTHTSPCKNKYNFKNYNNPISIWCESHCGNATGPLFECVCVTHIRLTPVTELWLRARGRRSRCHMALPSRICFGAHTHTHMRSVSQEVTLYFVFMKVTGQSWAAQRHDWPVGVRGGGTETN